MGQGIKSGLDTSLQNWDGLARDRPAKLAKRGKTHLDQRYGLLHHGSDLAQGDSRGDLLECGPIGTDKYEVVLDGAAGVDLRA